MKIVDSIMDIIYNISGDCSTCVHEKDCPYLDKGSSQSCWEGGFEPHYERREEFKWHKKRKKKL